MQKAFNCPHCEKKYPVLPTLVGRKVRCTACKNVFQLQYDGIAIKVNIAASVTENSGADKPTVENTALESKSPLQEQALEPNPTGAGMTQAPVASRLPVGTRQVVGAGRQQTKAILRKTERIKRIRSSLQDAAEEALSNVHAEHESESLLRKTSLPNKKIDVVLTGSGAKSYARVYLVVLLLLCGMIVGVAYLFTRTSPVEDALQHYTSSVSVLEAQYPLRMETYRSRMWIYSRDGLNLPPVVLNADSAELHFSTRIDWPLVTASSTALLEGLKCSRRFGIWYQAAADQSLELLWKEYIHQGNLAGFYKMLNDKKIRHVHFADLPNLLAAKGISIEAVYIASLLLAGTSDQQGSACNVFGLLGGVAPNALQVFELNGAQSHLLLDGHGHYSFASGNEFCGLMLGVEEATDQVNEWRVLDLRLGKSMAAFYNAAENPLCLAANVAHETLSQELVNAKKSAAVGSAPQ